MKFDENAKVNWLNRQSLSWTGYDVASSVYAGAVPAVLAPFYIREVSSSFGSPTAVWGLISALAVIVSSLAALAAASATSRVSRFNLLRGLTLALLIAMAALAWNPNSSLLQAALAFVAAQSFYFAATTIYESFLPDIVPAEARQKLSGFGWAMGYVGGIVAIVLLLVVVAGRPQSLAILSLCFATLAILAAVMFATVLLLMGREGFPALRHGGGLEKIGNVAVAFRHRHANPGVFQLLLATMLIQMAVFVVVTFTTPILADRFGQNLPDLLLLLLIIHVLSVPSTLAWSALLTGSPRRAASTILLACWGAVLLLLAFGSGPWMPLITVSVIGCCLGATFSGLRGFLAEELGETNSVAIFALATTAGRLAAALGPAVFSLVLFLAGERAALMAALAVLVLGSVVLLDYLRRADRRTVKLAVE